MNKTVLVFALILASLAGGYTLRATPAAAQSHAQVCQANYDQCAQACGGATGCTSQCQTNKDQCNSQGQ
jgi:hypothetical protein